MNKNKTVSIVCLISLLLATFLIQIGTSNASLTLDQITVLSRTGWTATAKSQYSATYSADKAIDGNLAGTRAMSAGSQGVGWWLQMDMGSAQTANCTFLRKAGTGELFGRFNISYSSDGSTWSLVTPVNSNDFGGNWNNPESLSNVSTSMNVSWAFTATSARYWRITAIDVSSGTEVGIHEIYYCNGTAAGGGGDTTAPALSAFLNTSITQTTAVFSWTTNEAANASIKAGTSKTNMTITGTNLTSGTAHGITITTFESNKTYYWNATSCDTAGNCNSTGIFNFTTLTYPPAISSVASSSVTNTTAIITWTTNTGSNSSVKYGTSTSNLTIVATNVSIDTAHRVYLNSMEKGKFYYYNVTSCDITGQCNSTGIFNFTTVNSSNAAPVIASSRISPTTAYFNTTLTGYCNATDSDNSILSYNYTWYKNGISIYNPYCYQETANISTSCGALSTGYYVLSETGTCVGLPIENAIDGNLFTGTSATGGSSCAKTIYINYTKPTNAINTSLWQIAKSNQTYTNYTIPSVCWNRTILSLYFQVYFNIGIYGYNIGCYNDTDWMILQSNTSFIGEITIYEERMLWYGISLVNNTQGIETNVSTLTGFTAGDNITLSCQAYDGNTTSSWLNSSVVNILNYNATVPVISSPANRTVYTAASSVTVNYNSTNAESTLITYYVFINDVLNRTATNGSFTQTYPDGIYNISIIANNGILNTSKSAYTWFAIDTTAPVISLISPPNNTINGTGNIIYTYSANDSILFLGVDGMNNCSLYIDDVLNQTNTTMTAGTRTFSTTTLTEGTHTWYVSCYDDYGKTSSTGKNNLIIDTTTPVASITPSNNSIYGFAQNVSFVFLATDDNFIYSIQANVSYPNGSNAFSMNYTDDGSKAAAGVSLNYTKKFPYTLNGTYTITYSVCDGHTAKDISGLIAEPTTKNQEIDFTSFKLVPQDKTNIVSASTTTEKDKITFDFNLKSVETTKINLNSKYKLVYFPNSQYKGHFIIKETKQWIDFEGYENLKITKVDDYNYVIETTPTRKILEAESTGALNCISGKSYFELIGTGARVYATNNLTGAVINDFSTRVIGEGIDSTKTTTVGLIEFNLSAGNYTFSINATGFGVKNVSQEITSNHIVNTSFYTLNSLYLLIYDEQTKLKINNVSYQLIGGSYGNYNTTNGTIYMTLNPDSYSLRYWSEGYSLRTFYFTLASGYNVAGTLYLLNSTTEQSNISVYVYDEGGDVVKEAYVKALKYDITTNTYVQVDVCKTNQQGYCYLILEKFTAYYEFVVDYNGVTQIVTSPNYIIADSVQIRISLGSIAGSDYDKLYGIYKNLEVVETGEPYFRYTYSDPLNVLTGSCLYVYSESVTGRTLVNSSCVTTTSGTIVIYPANVSNTTYKADAFGYINDKYIWFDSDYYSFETMLAINQYGIFIVIILTLIFIFIGLWSPSLMLVLTPLPLIIGNIMGIVQINLPALIGMEFVAIVIAFIISEKQVSSG